MAIKAKEIFRTVKLFNIGDLEFSFSIEQGILKQFEFWPIKRRLDRARHNLLENLEMEDEREDHPQSLRFLMRVIIWDYQKISLWLSFIRCKVQYHVFDRLCQCAATSPEIRTTKMIKLLINMYVADSISEQIREQNERGVLPGGIVLSL